MTVEYVIYFGANTLTLAITLASFVAVVLNLCVFFPGKERLDFVSWPLYSSHISFILYLSRASFVAAYMISLVLYDLVPPDRKNLNLEALLLGILSAVVVSHAVGLRRLNTFLFRVSSFGKDSSTQVVSADINVKSGFQSYSLNFYCFINSFLYSFALVLPIIWITRSNTYHLTIISLSSLVNLLASVIFFWQGSYWMQSYLQKVPYTEVARARLSASAGYVFVSLILICGIVF